MVDRLALAGSCPASRAPARPASATATCSSIPRSNGVRRPYRTVRPGTCSANVRRWHAWWLQNSRRTDSTITTRRPPKARSASRRR
jgi:hypothetical protein